MVSCPRCGKNNEKPASQWVGGRTTKSPMRVKRYVCTSCGAGFVAWTDRTGKTKTMTRKKRASAAP